MKDITKKELFQQFDKDKIKRQELIKGGPEGSRGTETTVQDDDED